MPKVKTKPCSTCQGTGAVPADDVGAILREEREAAGITGVDMARHCSISVGYLYDLEKDNRRWTTELVKSYQAGLEELGNGKR